MKNKYSTYSLNLLREKYIEYMKNKGLIRIGKERTEGNIIYIKYLWD
ncbi:hypothetical protein ACSW8X_16775 (plasmid) [Clostridium perfringens]|nr:hypothetical protein [Clostridium perfringens]ELC8368266.1 hypothetical protein [Clostridium perfringens]WVM62249.1 hypothetical protein V1657_16045 [Clostridium perfringens]